MRNWLIVIALTACNGPPSSRYEAIVGGTLDDADPAAIYLSIYRPQPRDVYSCGGLVVSPHVVVTAAHCLVHDGYQVWAVVGNPEMSGGDRSAWHQSSETHPHPEFDLALPDHDIGVVIFDQPLPVTPLAYSHAPLDASRIGSSLRLLGFGATDGSDANSNPTYARHQVTLPLAGVDDGDFWVEGGLCFGDSGGPSLMTIAGDELAVGIHSRTTTMDCSGQSFDTRLDAYASFIDPYIAMYDPPPSPSPSPSMSLSKPSSGCDFGTGPVGLFGLLVACGLALGARLRFPLFLGERVFRGAAAEDEADHDPDE